MLCSLRNWGLLLVAAVALPSTSSAFAQADVEPADAVTTRWLPDPFPNTPPRVLDRRMTVEAGTTGTSPSVLLQVYDIEQDPVSLKGFTQPQHGTLKSNADGTFSYTPKKDFVGSDSFQFTLRDRRDATGTAKMLISVVKPSTHWSATSFSGLSEINVDGKSTSLGKTVVPRAVDWNRDGKLDVLAAASGRVWLYLNEGSKDAPRFAAAKALQAGGKEIEVGKGRVALSWVDLDRDGLSDLVVVGDDRKVRWAKQSATKAAMPALQELVVVASKEGGDFIAADVRVEIADWNGDGLPDVLTGSHSGSIQVAYNVGSEKAPVLAAPTKLLDSDGRKIDGSYNLNVRIADLNQDGTPDFVESYNWGTINFRINNGTSTAPRLPQTGTFSVSGPNFAKVDLHALTDGPIIDFADFNSDGTLDLLMGGETAGAVRLAFGESGYSYLTEIEAILKQHPQDLGPYLADSVNETARSRMQTLQAALYDYVTTFASPSQKQQIVARLRELIAAYPQYFRHQKHDLKAQPGMPSLAAQVWLTMLVADYENPSTRHALVEAAQIPGAYRKLIEELGLIYIDNANNPRGAEAIYQWLRTVPREIYPGTGITANDWLSGDNKGSGRTFLMRGHLKNTFNGSPVDRGEYGFGRDARAVIGDRGTENQFMTVVHHEACHDLDAYVRLHPKLNRRWGQMLVDAGGPDMRANADTGWLDWKLTKQHFKDSNLWDGDEKSWDATLKKYWAEGRGAEWSQLGFMRGNIMFFYNAPQESLATQGNQYWNSTEGRLEVAIDRYKRGFKSNLSEVLFFMEIWSLGLDKLTFCENDNACRQVYAFAKLRRNKDGYIDQINLGDRYYEFAIDEHGRVTDLLHVPEPKTP